MGFLPCLLPCHSDKRSQSHSSEHLHSESSNYSSLSSQPSLPSVPSLTLPNSQIDQQTLTNIHYHCLATLRGHSSYVFSLTLAGNFLYSGSSNSEIRAWSLDPHTLPQSSTDHNNIVATSNGGVKSMVFSGDKLFSAHQDHKIRVWKIIDNKEVNQKGICVATLPTMNDRFFTSFSAKNYVHVRRHKKCTWVHHVDTISSLSISRDGSLLFSASWDRTFKVWQTSNFRCLESVANAHDDAINAIVLSNDGFVYTGSADKKIKVWKKYAGEKKHSLVVTLEGHKSAVNALALSTDGSVLYSGACDRSILVWERTYTTKSGTAIGTESTTMNSSSVAVNGGGHMAMAGALRGHSKAILCLAVVSDLVCSGSADNNIRIWRKQPEKRCYYSCLAVFQGHKRPVKCLTATVDTNNSTGPDDNSGTSYLVYSGSLDCDIRIWNIWVPIL